MSAVAPTPQQINQSIINKSPSKRTYSFSKAVRFTDAAKLIAEKFRFYEKPDTLSKRQAGIGIGRRFHDRVTKSPPPNAYKLPSGFKKDASKQAFTFGLSRDVCLKVFADTKEAAQIPGPGAYIVQKEPGNAAVKYSIRPRTASLIVDKKSSKNTPGPGDYESNSSINHEGVYFNSKFPNSGVRHFSPPRSKRFQESVQQIPGPGEYHPKIDTSANGDYFVSHYRSSGCRTFYHSQRQTIEYPKHLAETPGPGTYRAPSEFGYYEETPNNKSFSVASASIEQSSCARYTNKTRASTALGSHRRSYSNQLSQPKLHISNSSKLIMLKPQEEGTPNRPPRRKLLESFDRRPQSEMRLKEVVEMDNVVLIGGSSQNLL